MKRKKRLLQSQLDLLSSGNREVPQQNSAIGENEEFFDAVAEVWDGGDEEEFSDAQEEIVTENQTVGGFFSDPLPSTSGLSNYEKKLLNERSQTQKSALLICESPSCAILKPKNPSKIAKNVKRVALHKKSDLTKNEALSLLGLPLDGKASKPLRQIYRSIQGQDVKKRKPRVPRLAGYGNEQTEEASVWEEGESDSNIHHPFALKTEIVRDKNKNIVIDAKKIHFKKRTKYSLEDGLVDLTMRPVRKQKRNSKKPFIRNISGALHKSFNIVLENLKKYYNEIDGAKKHRQVYMTFMGPTGLISPIHSGNWDLDGHINEISEAMMALIENWLQSNTEVKLRSGFKVHVKILSVRHANDLEQQKLRRRGQKWIFNKTPFNGDDNSSNQPAGAKNNIAKTRVGRLKGAKSRFPSYLFAVPQGYVGNEMAFDDLCAPLACLIALVNINKEDIGMTIKDLKKARATHKQYLLKQKEGKHLENELHSFLDGLQLPHDGPFVPEELLNLIFKKYNTGGRIYDFSDRQHCTVKVPHVPSADHDDIHLLEDEDNKKLGQIRHVDPIIDLRKFRPKFGWKTDCCGKLLKNVKSLENHKCNRRKICFCCQRHLANINDTESTIQKRGLCNAGKKTNEIMLHCFTCSLEILTEDCHLAHQNICQKKPIGYNCYNCKMFIEKPNDVLNLKMLKQIHEEEDNCQSSFCASCKGHRTERLEPNHECKMAKIVPQKLWNCVGFIHLARDNDRNVAVASCVFETDREKFKEIVCYRNYMKKSELVQETKQTYCPDGFKLPPVSKSYPKQNFGARLTDKGNCFGYALKRLQLKQGKSATEKLLSKFLALEELHNYTVLVNEYEDMVSIF